MNRRFARLNHILIPSTEAERERFRRSRVGRFASRVAGLYYRATREGQLVAAAALFSGLTGLDVSSTDAHLLFSLATALLVASLVVSQRLRMGAARISVACPPRVTLGEELRFAIAIDNDSEQDLGRAQVVGPFLPWDGEWSEQRPGPVRVAPKSSVRCEARARFRQRGVHHLEPFRVARIVPLGLSLGPTIDSRAPRFVVVPKIATVLSLRMPQPRVVRTGGTPLFNRAGDSMDLLGTRPYRPGDRARDLHARSWARTRTPVVREYAQEATPAVGVLLDPSGVDDEAFDARLSLVAGMLSFLRASGAVPELIVASDAGRDLVIGPRFAAIEQALELLGCVETATAQAPEALAARVARRETPWTRALIVAGELGPWQSSVARALVREGIPCATFVVSDRTPESQTDASRVLSPERVLSGEGLLL
jgi:hypothetical protein